MEHDTTTFIMLKDGTALERQSDGSYRPVQTLTDWAYIDGLTDEQIEVMAASDPDHPPVDDEFWDQVDRAEKSEPVRVEAEILDFFKRSGPSYEARINAVLREHVAAQAKRTGS